ncbi:MAG: hypothetical protein VXZ38_10560, partial [Planctomycetota bacterium]|nr:hypothetical protein [Planctomycetota bacterium]
MTNGDKPDAPANSSPTSTPHPSEASINTGDPSAEGKTTETLDAVALQPETAEALTSTPMSPAPVARGSGPLAMRGIKKPSSPTVDPSKLQGGSITAGKKKKRAPRPRLGGEKDTAAEDSSREGIAIPTAQPRRSKISVPNVRHALPDDVQAEFENLLSEDDFSGMMEGPAAD